MPACVDCDARANELRHHVSALLSSAGIDSGVSLTMNTCMGKIVDFAVMSAACRHRPVRTVQYQYSGYIRHHSAPTIQTIPAAAPNDPNMQPRTSPLPPVNNENHASVVSERYTPTHPQSPGEGYVE